MFSSISRPTLHIIAGPNGAGKTTFAKEFLPLFADNCEFINADVVAANISPIKPELAAVSAGKFVLERIGELSEERVNFAVETTLSGKNFLKRFRMMKDAGYLLKLYYLWLPSPEIAIARVADRVSNGGHKIAEEVIRRRYNSGLEGFINEYSKMINDWILFDNSTAPRTLIARSINKKLSIEDEILYNLVTKYGHRRPNDRELW